MEDDVVITGVGVVSPAGIGKDHFWQGITSEQSHIVPIESFDTTKYTSKVAGVVKDFQATDFLDPRIIVQTDRWTHFDLVCAQQAILDAKIQILDRDPTRVGAVFSAGTGGNTYGQQQLHVCTNKGPNFVRPYLAIAWFYAASIGQVSIQHNIRGYGRNICAEATGGLIALAHAAKIIKQGLCDVVIVSGCDAMLCPYTFASHQASGLLSPSTDAYPYRPFDATRNGTIVGEGGAAFVLERKEQAQKRGAHIYAEIAGFGQSFDGIITREPADDGVEYAYALSQAIDQAHIHPEEIDWILCDGLGTPSGDISEVKALASVFGEQLPSIPASAPKSMIGRLFNGASTTDVLMAILGLEHNLILPTVGYTHPDPQCPIDCVPNHARSVASLQYALIGARGFGGFNAALVIKRPTVGTVPCACPLTRA